MGMSGRCIRGWVAALVLLGWAGVSGRTQWNSSSPQISQPPNLSNPTAKNPADAATAEIQHKQEKLRQDERQKRLVSDSDKLLALATQLHDDVSKTDKNILSVDVVRRADEIERLAHNVKERMKG